MTNIIDTSIASRDFNPWPMVWEGDNWKNAFSDRSMALIRAPRRRKLCARYERMRDIEIANEFEARSASQVVSQEFARFR